MIDSRLKRIEAQNSEMKTAMESLTVSIEKQLQASFQIRGSIYKVIFLTQYKCIVLFTTTIFYLCNMQLALDIECAKLFCLDVRREVPVTQIQVCYFIVLF